MRFLLLTFAYLEYASAVAIKNIRSTQCSKGVNIIAARGTNETAGEGRLQVLSGLIEKAIPGSTDEAVVYPAAVDLPVSEPEGVTDLQQRIYAHVAKCPTARLVLAGYSQGGNVVSDVLGGGTYPPFSAPLDEKYRPNIVAAVVFGDGTRTSGKPYDYGNSTGMGFSPRPDTTYLDSYGAVFGSWCTSGDPVCDDGGTNVIAHTTEVETWEHDAAKFIINLVKHGK